MVACIQNKLYNYKSHIAGARFALGCSIRTRTEKLHSCIAWLTIEQRNTSSIATFLNYTINSKMPTFLLKQIVYCYKTQNHNTRFAGNGHITQHYPKTNFSNKLE